MAPLLTVRRGDAGRAVNWFALLLVLVLHGSLLAAALPSAVKPKPRPVTMSLSRPDIEFLPRGADEAHLTTQANAGAVYGRPCEGREYRGIGITYGVLGTIDAVSPGGPARRAGIRIGDRLLSFMEVEGTAHVLIERGSEVMDLRLPMEPICHIDRRPPFVHRPPQ